MIYRITDTRVNINVTCPSDYESRVLAFFRLISYLSERFKFVLVSVTRAKDKTHMALRIHARQRSIVDFLALQEFLADLIHRCDLRSYNITFTYIS